MRQLLPFGCDPVDPAVLYGDLPPARTRPSGRCPCTARSAAGYYSDDQVVSNEGYRVRPPSTNSV